MTFITHIKFVLHNMTFLRFLVHDNDSLLGYKTEDQCGFCCGTETLLKWYKKDKFQKVLEQKQGDVKFDLLTIYHIVT